MARVVMICGKLCSGKTTYARKMAESRRAVVLSIDEIMLAMFGQHCGDMHEAYAARTEKYLLSKSLEFIGAGVDVIFDWGFWRREQRTSIRRFFEERGIACELHMLQVTDDEWQRRIVKRNADVLSGAAEAYYVDDNLARKFEGLFEMPDGAEIDAFVHHDYPEN